MLNPERIMTWLKDNVEGMRASRMKTLADITPAAMHLSGVGVLTLGRLMCTETTPKHNIKRVDRFLGNKAVEGPSIAKGIFKAFAPRQGRVLVLADWTDMANGKLLAFALPCNGRSVPFFSKAVAKNVGEGDMIRAENEALKTLGDICKGYKDIVIVADRGFGNQRWLGAVTAQGFHFVQRLSRIFYADTEQYIGTLRELNLRRKRKAHDWGVGTFGEDEAIHGRLVTAFEKNAKEPWYLVTDLDETTARQVVDMYRQRWWIEACFRDKKNRDWGLGLTHVNLKDYARYERLFYIVALAFIFLTAHGAQAEAVGFADGLKANTRKVRVLNLLRTGYHYIRKHGDQLEHALQALRRLVPKNRAPNWG